MPYKLLIKFCCLNEYKEIVNKMFYVTFCVSRTIICTQRTITLRYRQCVYESQIHEIFDENIIPLGDGDRGVYDGTQM